ncbi:MAG TPA: glycosyltransferase [Chryseosolibacter sp.]|nr:glycosyltransferase [Chryseosolibacter sp.]
MVLLTGLFIIYFILLIILLTGWKRAMRSEKPTAHGKEVLISIVIPARNEELTIGSLLADLAAQEYKRFEVIVVNDYSEDETMWVVSRFEMKNLQIIHNRGSGKKAALTTGIRQAKGSIIVTTDADCSVSPGWLLEIHHQFRNPEMMFAFGPVRMGGTDSFFDSLQRLEFSSLIGSGAATAALGLPTVCNGANLAFRKKAFLEVKGYEGNLKIPSGDDEFLMRKVLKRYPAGVRFVNTEAMLVTTRPQPDPQAFVNQRIRWASKWRYNPSYVTKGLAVFVLLIQITFVVNWFFVFTPLILQSLFLLTIKVILEAAFLLQVCRFLKMRWNWLAFFSLQVLYPFYVVGVGAASFFVPFQWKNRIFKP